jgi:hypothetical protein
MSDKPILTVIHNEPIQTMPDGSLDQFVSWINRDELNPSAAVRKLVQQYNLKKLDSSVIVRYIEMTFPDIDLSTFTFQIHDSGYPFGDLADLSDEQFDSKIKQLRENPPEW